eukprot:CAMPEP_0113936372 /NCGR_PEP_ID=MMETSP1339-20121228/3306_1 /TAXON_ID=94617 /ORGANISM="Fibrocapsa japonica" /LENGTH=298 /DNA_ID=CAMNT_0000938831 /DNA_START=20 /DNA_END=916 /DNA_ORIENTATION=- /assembly_acc=CAM_ASM_000762
MIYSIRFSIILLVLLQLLSWENAVAFQASSFLPVTQSHMTGIVVNHKSHQSFQRGNLVMMGRRSEKIAGKKGKEDLKRAKVFGRIGKKIAMAVKAGGDDPEVNKALADILKEAKAYNVPKDNIQRVMKKAMDDDVDYKEAIYEAYGYGGCGIIISCLTDNNNRATQAIKTALKKTEVKMAAQGSVMYNFDRKGVLEVDQDLDEDAVLEVALEAGVDDYEIQAGEDEGTTRVLTEISGMSSLSQELEKQLGVVSKPSLEFVPKVYAECGEEDYDLNLNAVELVEVLDDVDSVYHNAKMV